MIPISENLLQELSKDTQKVLPNVKAWMANLRYLENIDIDSSSYSMMYKILKRNPSLYLRMDSSYYDTQFSGPSTRVKDYGINSMDFINGEVPYSYVYLADDEEDYISTPNSSAFTLTNDIDIAFRVSPEYWAKNNQTIALKGTTGGNFSWLVTLSDTVNFIFATTGSNYQNTFSEPHKFYGTARWVRITRSSSTGLVTFYYSDDQDTSPSSWTTISSMTGITGSIYNSSAPVYLGAPYLAPTVIGATPYEGNIIYWQMSKTIGGAPSAIFSADDFASESSATCTSSTGQVWTFTKPSGGKAFIYKESEGLRYNNYVVIEKTKNSDTYLETNNSKRFIDTFNRSDNPIVGGATSSDTSDKDMQLYSLDYDDPYWCISSNACAWSYQNKHVPPYSVNLLKYNTLGQDNYIDFKLKSLPNEVVVVVGYNDENETGITLISGLSSVSGTKLIDNQYVIDYDPSLTLSTSKYYRLQYDAGYAYFYDMGTSEPSESSSGTLLMSGYSPSEIRSPKNTIVGIGNYGLSGTSIAIDYFAANGKTYLTGSHRFNGSQYIYGASDIGANTKDFYEPFVNSDSFTYSMFVTPESGGSDVQSLLWLGTKDGKTALRIAYIQSSGLIKLSMVNSAESFTTLTSNSPLSLDQRYVLSVVKSGTKVSLIIDGVEDAYTTVASEYEFFDILSTKIPTISLAADYAWSNLGDTSGYHLFSGRLSDISFFDYALDISEIDNIYSTIDSTATLPISITDSYTTPDNVFDGTTEESTNWAFTNCVNQYGKSAKVDGDVFAAPDSRGILDNFFWMDRTMSDGNGDLSGVYITMSFDPHPCNKIKLATSYSYGRINNFEYVLTTEDDETITGSSSFGGESIKYVDLDQKYNLKSITINVLSTVYPNDFARLYSIDPIWEVDLSQYVIDINYSKVRDNFDASLPIGATSANSGSITFDNTEKIFNTYSQSQFSKYLYPDTKLIIGLDHYIEDSNSYETITLSEDVYVDTWSFTNSSMTASVDFRDYSKYLQEENVEGFIEYGVTAGRAIKNLITSTGFANRKISYIDSYANTIYEKSPDIFIPIREDSVSIGRKIALSDNEHFLDETRSTYMRDSAPSSLFIASSLLLSETLSVQDSKSRQYDEFATEVYSPSYITYGYRPGGSATIYNSIDDTYWDAFVTDDEWTLEFMSYIPSDNLEVSTSFYTIFSADIDSTNTRYLVDFQPTSETKIKIKFSYKQNSNTYSITSDEISRASSHHIVITKTSGVNDAYELFISGKSHGTVSTPKWTGSVSSSKAEFSSASYLSNFAYYSSVLSDEDINAHYVSSAVSIMPRFRYLYAKDEVYWDAMLNIATADLGMFYFDEFGFFNYEYRNTLNESILNRYQQSQYNFSDDVNIISADLRSEVQVNRVVVKTNNSSAAAEKLSSLWSAQDGESLAVTTIVEDILPNSQLIKLANTTDPIWVPSGYLKIDDEIIKYEYLSSGAVSTLTRGMFGTTPSWHKAGSKAREARYYEASFSSSPAMSVRYPFITANIFESNIDIDYFKSNSFGAQVLISASTSVADGSLAIVQGTNPSTDLNYAFVISGISLDTGESNEVFSEQSASIEQSIRRYRLKEILIDNIFIQNKIYAKIVADYIISYYSSPVPILNMSVSGVPHLQLGDLITITNFDDLDIRDQKYWIIESAITYDGGVTQDMILRKYSDPVPERLLVASSPSAPTPYSIPDDDLVFYTSGLGNYYFTQGPSGFFGTSV